MATLGQRLRQLPTVTVCPSASCRSLIGTAGSMGGRQRRIPGPIPARCRTRATVQRCQGRHARRALTPHSLQGAGRCHRHDGRS